MKIYGIQGDLLSAQSINIDTSQVDTGFRYPWFDGKPKGNWNAPTGLYLLDELKPAANFYNMGSDLVFDETVFQLMGDLLGMAGEIFPLQVEGASQLYILNPTLRYDALDETKYVPQGEIDGEPYGIKQYAFLSDALGKSSLFYLSNFDQELIFDQGPLFAISGRQSEDDDFINRYLKNELTGLSMEELWSN